MNNEFDIAIVGMSCRFPGARNVDEFWRNLAEGVESIARLSDEEILESGVPASYLSNPSYVKAAPILDEPGHFDAAFFGFSPMEARTMDPQHRILLELAHEALEDAGYDPDRYPGRIGVFTGAAMNTYFMNSGLNSRFAEDYIPTLIGNDKDFLSTRISYKLNLKGPSITVQTACSTSLVAVHLARQSLLSGETDMALAGAISVRVPHRAGYFYDGGGVVSPDGHVRAFDAEGQWHRVRQRRRHPGAEATGGRHRRRRHHSCRHQGLGRQQRRRGKSRLHGAQRQQSGRRGGRGAGQCRGRGGQHQLHRGPRFGNARRRSHRDHGADQGVPHLHAALGLLRHRFGQRPTSDISMPPRASPA